MRWRKLAACRGMDTDFFFPGGSTGNDRERISLAKQVCAGCPVRAECLEFAIGTGSAGIFGGTTDLERKRMQ
jgi:WhiB family transcriptional regulator, redox-sensing transcriptional regulator